MGRINADKAIVTYVMGNIHSVLVVTSFEKYINSLSARNLVKAEKHEYISLSLINITDFMRYNSDVNVIEKYMEVIGELPSEP